MEKDMKKKGHEKGHENDDEDMKKNERKASDWRFRNSHCDRSNCSSKQQKSGLHFRNDCGVFISQMERKEDYDVYIEERRNRRPSRKENAR